MIMLSMYAVAIAPTPSMTCPLYPSYSFRETTDSSLDLSPDSSQKKDDFQGNGNVLHLVSEVLKKINPWTNQESGEPNQNSSKDQIAKDNCSTRIEQAKKRFLDCAEAQKLWHDVEKEGKFSVGCAPRKNILAGAQVALNTRQILIEENQENIVPLLLFELNNLKRAKQGSLLTTQKCSFSAEKYANLIEALEYESAKDSYQLAGRCVKEKQWPVEWHAYLSSFDNSDGTSWHDYKKFSATQKNTGHTDLVQMRWYEECDPEELTPWFISNIGRLARILQEGPLKEQDSKTRRAMSPVV